MNRRTGQLLMATGIGHTLVSAPETAHRGSRSAAGLRRASRRMGERKTSVAYAWGSTPEERVTPFPCDRHLAGAAEAYFRALEIAAPPPVVFRWLCQLKVAPYSYDWIDNFGRRRPQCLTLGLAELAVGQRFMMFFKLVEFEPDRHLTLLVNLPIATVLFGDLAVSYVVFPRAGSRLVVKLLLRYPRGPVGWAQRWLLPWGDLLMMRKQLLSLKRLAEAEARAGRHRTRTTDGAKLRAVR